MGSVANIDQQKIFFPAAQNMIDFARKINASFIPWSCGTIFEG